MASPHPLLHCTIAKLKAALPALVSHVPFPLTAGEFSLMLAAARALESAGTSDAAVMASEMAALTVSDPGRRYPPYARLLLETLTGPGLPLESIPYLAEKFLDVSKPLSPTAMIMVWRHLSLQIQWCYCLKFTYALPLIWLLRRQPHASPTFPETVLTVSRTDLRTMAGQHALCRLHWPTGEGGHEQVMMMAGGHEVYIVPSKLPLLHFEVMPISTH